jgi:hypothetical protein
MIQVKNTWLRAKDIVSIEIIPTGDNIYKVVVVSEKTQTITIENLTFSMAQTYAKSWNEEIKDELREQQKEKD